MPPLFTSLLSPVLYMALVGTPALDAHQSLVALQLPDPAPSGSSVSRMRSEEHDVRRVAAGRGAAGHGAGRFSWPMDGSDGPPQVVGRFQPPARPYGPGHRGVDLAGVAGQMVLAAGDGLVVFAGQVGGRGVVSVEHFAGLRTTYQPVTASVRVGQHVRTGEVIGRLESGHPGHTDDSGINVSESSATSASGACLHWGVRRGHEYLDPLRLLNLGTVRLLPWSGG